MHLFSNVFLAYLLKDRKRQDPQKPLYELQDFSLGSIGSQTAPVLRAKAAESGTLLLFATELADRYKLVLPHGEPLAIAGRALERYLTITRSCGNILKVSDRQGLVDSAVRFLSVRAQAGIDFKPKMHLFVHLCVSAGRFGNPLFVATWEDEGMNMQLAAVSRTAYATVWSRRVLATFAHPAGPLGPSASKRTRR